MDYQAFDRGAIQYLVSCEKNGTRFYLTERNTASDIQDNARRYRDATDAHLRALEARAEHSWKGFKWSVCRRIMGGELLLS